MTVGSATGLRALEEWIAHAHSPVLYFASTEDLLGVPGPPEVAPGVPRRASLPFDDFDDESRTALFVAVERAGRAGSARLQVRWRGASEPTLVKIIDLRPDHTAFGFVLSDNVPPDDPESPDPEEGPELVAVIPGACLALDSRGVVTEATGETGLLELEQLVGQSLLPFIHEDDRPAAIRGFAAALDQRGVIQGLTARLDTARGWRWFDAQIHSETREGSYVVVVSVVDTDDDVRAHEAVAESELHFRTLAESIPVGVFRSTLAGLLTFTNEEFEIITGMKRGDRDWVDVVHRDDYARLMAQVEGFFADERLALDIRIQVPGAGLKHVRVLARTVPSRSGDPVEVIGSVEDVTERVEGQARLSFEATHDALTGLANRSALSEHLVARLRDIAGDDEPLAVLFIDLDGFKRVNDSLGHGVGDLLLQALAGRLEAIVRPEDFVARFGGDEFVVVSEHGDADGALALAHRVLRDLSQPVMIGGVRIRPLASVGVAIGSRRNADAEGLMRDADAAMYVAKSTGPGNVGLADTAVRREASRRFTLERDFHDGLTMDQFLLEFQPIRDLNDSALWATEGTLRWRHPDYGAIEPAEIQSIAEDIGRTHELARWTVDRACRDVIAARTLPGLRHLRMHVNLTNLQLSGPDYASEHLKIVSRHGLAPGAIVVELCESRLAEPSPGTESSVWSLAAEGVEILLDDFGSGHSSLAYLTRLPVTSLKLAADLVEYLPRSPQARIVARGIVRSSEELGINVIATGLDHPTELEACRELGIRLGQGRAVGSPSLVLGADTPGGR